jgi:hypothetical protein
MRQIPEEVYMVTTMTAQSNLGNIRHGWLALIFFVFIAFKDFKAHDGYLV